MKSEGMRTYGNFGKRLDYKGNGGECRGMVRTTQEMMGILRNICLMMGSSPHLRGTRILTVPSQIQHVPMTNLDYSAEALKFK